MGGVATMLWLLMLAVCSTKADWPSANNNYPQNSYSGHPQQDAWARSPWTEQKSSAPIESSWNSPESKPWNLQSSYGREELKQGYGNDSPYATPHNQAFKQNSVRQASGWPSTSGFGGYGQDSGYQGFGTSGSHHRMRRDLRLRTPEVKITRKTTVKKVSSRGYLPQDDGMKDGDWSSVKYSEPKKESLGLWLQPKAEPKEVTEEKDQQIETEEVTQVEKKEKDGPQEVEIEVVARGDSQTSLREVSTTTTDEDKSEHTVLDDGYGYGHGHGGGHGYGGGAHYGGGHNQYGHTGGYHGNEGGGFGGGAGHQGSGSYQGEGGFDRGAKWHGNHHGSAHGRHHHHGHHSGGHHGDHHGHFKKGHKDHYKHHGQRYKTYSYGGHGWYKERHHGHIQGHGGLQGQHHANHQGHYHGKHKGGASHKHSHHGHIGGWKNEHGWH